MLGIIAPNAIQRLSDLASDWGVKRAMKGDGTVLLEPHLVTSNEAEQKFPRFYVPRNFTAGSLLFGPPTPEP